MGWSFVFFPSCIATLIRNSPSIEYRPRCRVCFNNCHWPRTFERKHQHRASQGKSCGNWLQLMTGGEGAGMERWCSRKLDDQVLTEIVVFGKPARAAACSLPLFAVWSPYWQTAAICFFLLLGKRDFSSAALSRLGDNSNIEAVTKGVSRSSDYLSS